MIKTLILILILFSFNSFADYINQENLTNCLNDNTYSIKTRAINGYYKIPSNFNCKYYRLIAVNQDDLNRPIFTKNEVEACADQADCESKNGSKTCADGEESVIMAGDYSEIYCSKNSGSYHQLSVTKVREDASLKSAYESAKVSSDAQKSAIKSKLQDMVIGREVYAAVRVANEAKGLSKGQKRQLRTDLAEIRDDLFDGSLCSARADVAALTPDGTLITASDVTTVLAMIDSRKNCP